MSVTTSKGAPAVRVYDNEDTPVREAVLQEEAQRPRVPESRRISRVRGAQQALSFIPPLVLALIILLGWYVITSTGRVNSLLLPASVEGLVELHKTSVFITAGRRERY